MTAAELAKEMGIKIYTIGVGTKGMAPYPVDDPYYGKKIIMGKVSIDEKLLKEIATSTGGKYFRATNNQSLENVFEEINSLEKGSFEINEFVRYEELFLKFLIPAIFLIILSVFFNYLIIKNLP